jgi:AcrR family transcriptional regulator
MTAARRMPARRRRDQLLTHARVAFAERGFHDAGMDEIAEAAGVTKPVLYQHFRSKRELFHEVLGDVGERLVAVVTSATATAAGPRERVEAGFRAYFGFIEQDPAAFRLLYGATVRHDEEFDAVLAATVDRIAEAVLPLIEIPGPDQQRRVVSHALVGIGEAVARRELADGTTPFDPDALTAWVVELVWYGLRGVRASTPTPP